MGISTLLNSNTKQNQIMTKFKYFVIFAKLGKGGYENLYGSYDKSEAQYELEAMRDHWKDEGYRGIKLGWKATEESPDVGIYGKDFKPKTA